MHARRGYVGQRDGDRRVHRDTEGVPKGNVDLKLIGAAVNETPDASLFAIVVNNDFGVRAIVLRRRRSQPIPRVVVRQRGHRCSGPR